MRRRRRTGRGSGGLSSVCSRTGGGTPQGVTVGRRYFTRRLQLGLDGLAPSPTALGAIRTTGWVTVIAADQGFALARVDYACDNVQSDDYLEPYIEPVLPATTAADGPPRFVDWNAERYQWEGVDLGRVLFGPDRRQTFGAGDLANIDRGTAKGIGIGTRARAALKSATFDVSLIARLKRR